MLIGFSLMGQGSKNPFDLKYKKPQTEVKTNVVLDTQEQVINAIDEDSLVMIAIPPSQNSPSEMGQASDTTRLIGSTNIAENPFNIIRVPSKELNAKINSPKITEPSEEQVQEKDSILKDSGFMFWVLLGILLVFTSIFGAARGKLSQISSSFLNENFLRQTHRSNQGSFSFLYIFLYILALINIAIFAYLLGKFFNWERPNSILLLAKIVGIVSLIFIGKHVLLSLVGYIFPVHKELSLYNFTIMIFGIILGLFLFPINIVIAYAPMAVGKGVVYLSLGAIIAIYVFRMIRGLSIGSKYLVLHKFHFFIYLCTVEILPVIVLLKILDNYTGISII